MPLVPSVDAQPFAAKRRPDTVLVYRSRVRPLFDLCPPLFVVET